MLEQSLFELALATCFSSDRLAKWLKSHLLHQADASELSRDAFHPICLQLLRDDLDADYPRRFRLNDIDHALQATWPKQMVFGPSGYDIPAFSLLFDRSFMPILSSLF